MRNGSMITFQKSTGGWIGWKKNGCSSIWSRTDRIETYVGANR